MKSMKSGKAVGPDDFEGMETFERDGSGVLN